jgi:hypothetical protein
MTMAEIKPCPFCGKKPKIIKDGWGNQVWVECVNPKCRIHPMTRIYIKEDAAIKAWNRRCDNV